MRNTLFGIVFAIEDAVFRVAQVRRAEERTEVGSDAIFAAVYNHLCRLCGQFETSFGAFVVLIVVFLPAPFEQGPPRHEGGHHVTVYVLCAIV